MAEKTRSINLPIDIINQLKANPLSRGLYISQTGIFLNGDGGSNRPDGYPTALIVLCTGGEGFVRTSDIDEVIRPGDIYFLPADKYHAYGSRPGKSWDIYWAHFGGHDFMEHEAVFHVGEEALSRILRQFLDFFTSVESAINAAGYVAASQQLRLMLAGILAAREQPEQSGRHMIKKTINYMQAHLSEYLSIDQLAEQTEYSRSHFCLQFKKLIGTTPIIYFNQLKIRRACELLETTPMRINEIGEAVGIDNPYYFSRLFKRIIGLPPREFRKQRLGI